MTDSILIGTKKIIGVPEEDTSFDIDIITHINSVFSVLQQLGVGPSTGFMVEDDCDEWSDYITDNNQYNMVRTYMFLKTKMFFDPPPTSYMIDAMNKQIQELEFRLHVQREFDLDPVDPMTISEEEVDV